MRNKYKFVVKECEGNRTLGTPWGRLLDVIKMNFQLDWKVKVKLSLCSTN
jgi:hypothetical protein